MHEFFVDQAEIAERYQANLQSEQLTRQDLMAKLSVPFLVVIILPFSGAASEGIQCISPKRAASWAGSQGKAERFGVRQRILRERRSI